jgi:outer membrane protein, multidrug efflux system
MTYRSLLLPLIALAVGCASAPRVKPPPVTAGVPDAWHTAAPSAAPSDTAWWRDLGDVRLDSLVAEALAENHNLQAASASVQAAAAQAKIAGAPLYPQAAGRFGASRRKQNFVGLPIPSAGGGITTSTQNAFGVSLDVSWEMDLWGQLSAGKSAALADYQAASAEFAGARLSLTAQTAKAWFAAVESRRQLELAEATVTNYETTADLVRKRYERGLRPSLDLRLTLASLAGSQAMLQQRRAIHDRALRQMELLLGRYPAAELETSSDLPSISGQVPAGLPANLVARRPDLVAAERRLAASYSRHRQARRALLPRISLTGSAGTSTGELGDLLNGDFGVWSLVANVVQPLFQGGRIRGGIDLAKAGSDAALARYVQSALVAFGEVESTLAAEAFLTGQEEAAQQAAEQSLAARSLAEDRYKTGLSGLITMLEAQRRAHEAESQLLSVRRLRLDNRVNLHLALGGGFTTGSGLISSITEELDSGVADR